MHILELLIQFYWFFYSICRNYYARAEGLSTLNQGIRKLVKNEIPAYEMISGALIAVGAIFLIIPGFGTDFLGFLIIFPPTRKILFKKFTNRKKKNNVNKEKLYWRRI